MKKRKILIICSSLFLFVGLFISYTLANRLNNDVLLDTNTELIYYLNIKYDGVDINGNASSNISVSEINSDIIYVEDKLPEGINFTGFVSTSNGSIGAIERNNNNISCLGSVIDDTNETGNSGMWINNNQEYIYHGLHYNAETRIVSFKVENLKAGCQLTVGIKTTTPKTIDDHDTTNIEKRRDFYNVASVSEKLISTFSNVVHAYIGISNIALYTVTYEYENGTNKNAPALPPTMSYPKGAIVSVNSNLSFNGYIFNGWTSNDVTISNGKFTMPEGNVVIKGSFTPQTAHSVTYTLTGVKPSTYNLPITKSYFPGTTIFLDSLKVGDIINGYVFKGWTSNDVTISNGKFQMPNENVSIIGNFEEVSYSLTYQFKGEVLPDNSENLLPTTRNYAPGTKVTLDSVTEPEGYKFLGWYMDNSFKMPDKNLVVFGEWKRYAGTFVPQISISDVTSKSYYKIGDKIRYKITVTNNESYPIKNIIIKENLKGASFIEGNGYSISSTIATINSIAANSSFDLYSEYTVKLTDNNVVTNSINIKSGSSDNYYELAPNTYNASVSSNLQSKIKICANIVGADVGNKFQVKIFNSNYEYWVVLSKDQCKSINVEPGTYKIFELLPQEYQINSVTGAINSNNTNLIVNQGNNYQINFNNKFVNKKFLHSFGSVTGIIEGGNE